MDDNSFPEAVIVLLTFLFAGIGMIYPSFALSLIAVGLLVWLIFALLPKG